MLRIIMPLHLIQMNFWVQAAMALYSANEASKDKKRSRGFQDTQVGIMGRQQDMAEEQWARFQEVFAPVEDELVADAMAEPDYAQAEGQAVSDVQQSFGKAEEARRREMGRYGLDPSMGRSEGMAQRQDIEKAKAEVGGRTMARREEDDKAWAKKIAVTSLGKGLQSNAQTALSDVGRGYGNLATGAAQSAAAGNQAAGYWAGQAVNSFNKQGETPSNTGFNSSYGNSGVVENTQQDFQYGSQKYGLTQ